MDVFAALADPVRRTLLRRLAHGPARVVDLTAEQAITRPAISRHLRLLREAGLVEAETIGRERHHRLRAEPLAEVRELLEQLSPAPPVPETALDALATEVRRTTRDRRSAAGTTHPHEETA